jgi:light-regulated signal transduction histidine kinase (bacteriophytochrome)
LFFRSIVFSDDVPIILRHEARRGREDSLDFRVISASGKLLWFNHVCRDMRDASGMLIGRRASNRDITERKEIEARYQLLNDELEERVAGRTAELRTANDELEAFVYSVSHDLRSPLRGINGYLGILEEEESSELSEKGLETLGKVRESARRMGQLIDDLLEFARIGRVDLEHSVVDMNGLARSVLEEALAGRPGCSAEVAISSLLPVVGDSALLRQVWSNLISNALKFSAGKERPRVEITCAKEGMEIKYRVKDNGAGFDMRYRAKLFHVFQRLHGTHEFEGTGVGLAIVQRVVERHGGSVDAVGKVGEGAEISFSLPDKES